MANHLGRFASGKPNWSSALHLVTNGVSSYLGLIESLQPIQAAADHHLRMGFILLAAGSHLWKSAQLAPARQWDTPITAEIR